MPESPPAEKLGWPGRPPATENRDSRFGPSAFPADDGGGNMAATANNRRVGSTRFFVPDPAFGWYMRAVGMGAVLAACGFGALLWWYHGKLLDLLGLYDMIEKPGVRELLSEYSHISLFVTGVAMLGGAGFVLLLSLYCLHRIAGPVYRLKMHMMEIMNGTPPRPVRFRNDDQFRDLADLFNEFMVHVGLIDKAALAAQSPARSQASTWQGQEKPARAGRPGA